MMKWCTILVLISIHVNVFSQKGSGTIMTQKERAAWVDSMLAYRMEYLLPDLLRREGIDMWILISREDNEDPVMKTILPAEWLSARRRTIMVFYDPGMGKRLTHQLSRVSETKCKFMLCTGHAYCSGQYCHACI